MPYSTAHKQQTRARILRAAARAFRAEGIAGVSVPEVMRAVGLTHGGFYAHFASKDALASEACATAFGEAAERLFDQAARAAPDEALPGIVRAYLSRAHRDQPEEGCVVPTLGAEVARGAPAVRAAFTHALRAYARRLAAYMPARDAEPPRVEAAQISAYESVHEDEALVLLAGMAGALQLARAVDDPDLSDGILRAARTFYLAAFGTSDDSANPVTEHLAAKVTSGTAETPAGEL